MGAVCVVSFAGDIYCHQDPLLKMENEMECQESRGSTSNSYRFHVVASLPVFQSIWHGITLKSKASKFSHLADCNSKGNLPFPSPSPQQQPEQKIFHLWQLWQIALTQKFCFQLERFSPSPPPPQPFYTCPIHLHLSFPSALPHLPNYRKVATSLKTCSSALIKTKATQKISTVHIYAQTYVL